MKSIGETSLIWKKGTISERGLEKNQFGKKKGVKPICGRVRKEEPTLATKVQRVRKVPWRIGGGGSWGGRSEQKH